MRLGPLSEVGIRMRVVDLARACGSHDRRLTARALGAPRLPTRQPRRWCAWPGSGREPTTLWPRLIEFGHRIGSVPPRRNRRTVRSGRLGWRRRSLHNGPSITASQLRQRAEAVKSLPRRRPGPTRTLFGSPAKRVALTAEHAAARSWPIDHPIRLKPIVLLIGL